MGREGELFDKYMLIRQMVEAVRNKNTSKLGPLGDTTRGRGRVLALLKQKDGVSTKEMATVMGIRVSSLNEVLGKMEKDGKILYRYVARDYRIYFEVIEGKVVVHRVLHANSLNDFLFRTNISPTAGEDEILSQSKHFWKLIDEGKKASKA